MIRSDLRDGDYIHVINGGYNAKIIEQDEELMIKALENDRVWPLFSENPECFVFEVITDERMLKYLSDKERGKERQTHKVTCYRCERYIGESDEESPGAVCLDCYGKKGELK